MQSSDSDIYRKPLNGLESKMKINMGTSACNVSIIGPIHAFRLVKVNED
jgi:hypothetical protein